MVALTRVVLTTITLVASASAIPVMREDISYSEVTAQIAFNGRYEPAIAIGSCWLAANRAFHVESWCCSCNEFETTLVTSAFGKIRAYTLRLFLQTSMTGFASYPPYFTPLTPCA
ncbi:hypothetical protein BC629DRAFT_1435226 [Irpex lacteus]|nr:hypothetical protein BC629DRAFT_1435226 [Irpex lacteus]